MKILSPLVLLALITLVACHAKKPIHSNPTDSKPVVEEISKDTVPVVEEEIMVKKPIIYLYPRVATNVKVQLEFDGKLIHTYPKYPEGGWKVKAQPNGDLLDEATGKEYYALFWEGETKEWASPTEGFVVEGENTAAFLEEKLAILGLSAKEANEFIIFWLPLMENNAYNLIHFAGETYTKLAALNIEPSPETLIRVFMLYQPLKQPIKIKEQSLVPVQRKGFTVVEWGGAALKKLTN